MAERNCETCAHHQQANLDPRCGDCMRSTYDFPMWELKEQPEMNKGCHNCKYEAVDGRDLPCCNCYDDKIGQPTKWEPTVVQEIVEECSRIADAINPDHYKVGGIETIDYMKAKLSPEEYRGYLRGNALKYLSRLGNKDEAQQEAKKAQWYIGKLVEALGDN